MSTDRARQAAGQPTGGQFAATAGTDAGLDLADEQSPVLTYEELASTPTEQDMERARQRVREQMVWNDLSLSFERVMGRGARRTAANKAAYQAHLDKVMAEGGHEDPGYEVSIRTIAEDFARNEAPARAYEQGIEIDPAQAEEFDGIWEGKTLGHSEADIRRELAELTQMQKDFEAGRIPPSRVVGTGLRNPRAAAKEYLVDRIAQQERALRTRGRSLSVNVSNVEYRMHQRKREMGDV